MKRRRLVALVSVAVLFTLGLAVVTAILVLTRMQWGRDKFLTLVIRPLVSSRVHGGSIYIGHLGGNLLTYVTIDSFAIRDARGDYLVATGSITANYSVRDLVDSRIYITRAEVSHPYVHLIQHSNNEWNFKEIFRTTSSNVPPLAKDSKSRSLGDYIVIDSAHARNINFSLTMPWTPDDTLRGRLRDSVIQAHLTNPNKAVSKTFDGYGRTYAWTNGSGLLTHARLADPDSDRKFGREFKVASLSIDEFEPTFQFRRVQATVRHLADSIWFEVPHFDMPASTGTAKGRVWWGNEPKADRCPRATQRVARDPGDCPVRYDIAIHGDSVSLNDVNWVYATLPRTGGGTLDLLIKNDPKNFQVVNFILQKMDVRSTKSHLTGDMSFGTGAPILLVRNVDVRADPVDFDLIRTLAGKPFPQDWQGQLLGTVKARGGPLTNFVVDDMRGIFRDAHVPGAVSRFSGKGELDILVPALTKFHNFYVDAGSVDLRTVEYVFPSFVPLHGFISGTATLDSSYLDVRFSNANVVHQDGPGEPSRFTGSGRITDGDKFVAYDVALDAQPVSMTMLSRSFAWIPLRGVFNGPVRAKGTSPDLEISASLQGAAGAFSFDGRADIDSIGGTGYHGRGQFSAVNLPVLLEKPQIPGGVLSGHYDVDLVGITPSYSEVQGTADVAIERTVFDSLRVGASYAHAHFADGRMTIDSLRVPTTAGTLVARGGIGLPQGRPDSMSISVIVDSLGGLRRYFPAPDTTRLGAAATPPDSLSSSVLRFDGWITGTFDSLNASGRLRASDLYVNNDRGQSVEARFDLHDVLRAPTGTFSASMDTVTLAGMALDSLGLQWRMDDSSHARFAAGALFRNGPTASTAGSVTAPSGLTTMLAGASKTIVLDSLGLGIGDSHWRLASSARFTIDSTRSTLDSLVLRNGGSAFIAVSANVPDVGPAAARLTASQIPLRDVGTLLQLSDTVGGVGEATFSATGTKANPEVAATATLSSVNYAKVGIDRVTLGANYASSRLKANGDLVLKGQTAVTAVASVPMDLSLFSYKWRGTDSLSGFLRADSADLSLAQTLLKSVVGDVSGRMSANVTASGTPRAPVFGGTMSVANGSALVVPLNVTVSGITVRMSGSKTVAGQDSIRLDTLYAVTVADGKSTGRISASGWVKNLIVAGSPPSFSLDVRSNNFHAYNRRSVADVYVTTTDPLRLRGSVLASTLTGALYVDRGSIFLADRDIARKQAVQFISETTLNPDKADVAARWSTLMTNLNPSVTVTLGSDVRLRSKEANVKLNGSLSLQTSTDRSTRKLSSTGELVPVPSLEGVLKTESGTYNLNLGLVQREFTVQPEGTVTFNGAADNPTLDIKAKYDVKQYHDRDLGVIVHLYGPLLPYPVIGFESTADYEISTSDLLSYLLTGKPGFDFSASPGSSQIIASFLAPTISALAADRLRQSLGSVVDAFQFQFGAYGQDPTGTTRSNFTNALYGATIAAEKQFKNNIFLSVNTGLCQFNPDFAGGRNVLTGLGAKLEYRVRPELSFQTAYDPPTASRTCGVGQTGIGFVSTPQIFSFSLSHSWRF